MIRHLLLAILLLFGIFLIAQNRQAKGELKAQASEKIVTPVILEEKDLRKINEVLLKRIKEIADSNGNISYKVSFSNNSYYRTNDLEYILKEENTDLAKITDLELIASNKRNSDFNLLFNRN